jgi:HEPN domain-containing protein
MEAKHQLVKDWLNKARRDLLSAKRLASGKEPYLDTAIYHCQQSAEKALKGWLLYHDRAFEKTHDLRLLVTLAAEIEIGFEKWFDAAEQINPYATAYRYPGEVIEPDRGEYERAFKIASELYEYVCSLLPPELSVRS